MADRRAYDLMILIDADVPEDRREAILQAVRSQIGSGDGELKGDADWGVRRLAYEIDDRPEAYYHLFQLEAASELLRGLEHNLSIDDAVLRFRVIRLEKGVPETTPRPSAPTPRYSESAEEGEPAGAQAEAQASKAPSEASGAPSEAPEATGEASEAPSEAPSA